MHSPNIPAGTSTPPPVDEPAVATHLTQIAPEDCFTIPQIGAIALSPDGSALAYRHTEWRDGKRCHDLQVLDTASGALTTIVRDPLEFFAPQWSAGGKSIYFASHGDDGTNTSTQVWVVRPDEKKPRQLTSVPGGISRFVVTDSGISLYFTKHVDVEAGEWGSLKSRFKKHVQVGHGIRQATDLWKVDLSSERANLVHSYKRFITSFSISPDETCLAIVSAPDQRLITNEGQSTIETLDLRSGKVTTLPSELWRSEALNQHSWIEIPAWSPDSTRLAFRIGNDALPTEIIIADLSGDSPQLQLLPRPLECHPRHLRWHRDSRTLFFTADHRAAIPLIAVNTANPSEFSFLVDPDAVIHEFSVARNKGRVAMVQSTPESFPELFFLEDQKHPLTSVHTHTANWDFPSRSRFEWTAPDGTVVEGILELPPGHTPGSPPLPLLVELHGGPNAAGTVDRQFGIRGNIAFASKGYAVLHPNFRGSTGYGDSFVTDLIGNTNRMDVNDVLTGIDALIEKGIVDPDRQGMMGWSYGGFLVNCLLLTNRFQVASTGAGMVDMTLQFGSMDTPGHAINLMGGLPWTNAEEYLRASPLFHLHSGIKTATLIHHGEDDVRVPVSHAHALHRALEHYLDAPCELVVYPGAGHGLSVYEQQVARLTWDHAWFEKHLA